MQRFRFHPAAIFILLWSLLFLLYLPAARCGWVSDTLGWLDALRHQSFSEYLNRSRFGVRSFYQTTQAFTWALYRILGVSPWAWHLVHISLQALNAALCFTFCRGLLRDSGIGRNEEIAFAVALLFSTSPYLSEVIVWEASFHYLQGLCFILLILTLLRRFLRRPQALPALMAGILFLFSAFSLELFYLTPLLTGSLLLYYRYVLQYERTAIRKAAAGFLLPQVLIFVLHLLLVRIVFGTASARLGDALLHMPLTYYAVKPPDYGFHLLGGRFLPQSWRSAAHQAFCTYAGAGLFYVLLGSLLVLLLLRYRRMQRPAQLSTLFFLWLLLAMGLVTPMWFPERLLILGDRYLYIMLPFFFMLAAMLVARLRSVPLRLGILLAALLLQCTGTLYVNWLWQRSQRITDNLQRNFSAPAGANVLLLNSPQSLRGAPMIGAGPDGEMKLMHDLLYGPSPGAFVRETFAQEMATSDDSIGIRQLDALSFLVRLPRPGACWWYGSDYARSYSGPGYEVILLTPDTYRLILNGDPQRYMLMYQQSGIWKRWENAYPPTGPPE